MKDKERAKKYLRKIKMDKLINYNDDYSDWIELEARIAQQEERTLGMGEVSGSIPDMGLKNEPLRLYNKERN